MTRPTQPLFVIHHGGGCHDGLAAALAARVSNPDVTHIYHPGAYDKDPPYEAITNQHVYLVDFSYSRDQLMEMAKLAKTVTILDHHKTARDDLTPFIARDEVMAWDVDTFEREAQAWQRLKITENRSCFIRAKFDMKKSGAVLSWEHFNPNHPVPLFFQYIQDRDLWIKALPNIELFTWGLRSYPMTLQEWGNMVDEGTSLPFEYLFGDLSMQQHLIDSIVEEGYAVERFFSLQVESALHAAHPIIIVKSKIIHEGLACNVPGFMASEVAGKLAERSPDGWGATYYASGDGFKFSLRSRPGADGTPPFDVGELAKSFSCTGRGGGHTQASGFEISDTNRLMFGLSDGKVVLDVLSPRVVVQR